MKHLITGGSGFLGSLIAKKLYEKGESVKILDVWEDQGRTAGIEFIKGDVCDRVSIANALKGIDIVHHNAALVPLTKSGDKFRQVNVDGSRIVAEESVKAGVQAFVHMSSSAVYGLPKDQPITDQTSLNPIEIYGRSKLNGEQCVKQICQQAHLPLIVVRPRTILGKGRLGIFEILFKWIQEGRNVYVIGSGNIRFQFVHAEDLMGAYMLILSQQKFGTYNIGTDRYGTLRNALENLIVFAQSESKVKSLPERLTITSLKILDMLNLSPLAPWHYLTYHKDFCFDMTKLMRLGWRARYSNDEMLNESYRWFKAHGSKVHQQGVASKHRSPVSEKILKAVKYFS